MSGGKISYLCYENAVFSIHDIYRFTCFLTSNSVHSIQSNKLSLHFQETPKGNSQTWTFKPNQLPWILATEEELLKYENLSYESSDTDSETDFITDEELE